LRSKLPLGLKRIHLHRPKEFYARESGDYSQHAVLGDSERLTQMIAHDWEVSQIDEQQDTQLIRLNLVYVMASSPELQTVHQVLVVFR
jgi:hypothetical protein